MRRFSSGTAVLALLLVLCGPANAGGCSAEPFVKRAGAAFMNAAKTKTPSAFSGVAGRYADLRAIALFALGPHRGSLAKAQEAEYVALTHVFIGKFMARHAGKFSGSELEITGCAVNGKLTVVHTRLASGKPVIFRLVRSGGGYLVQDINVSSVWLAQQLRANFVGVIRRGGDIAALFAYLRG